MFLLYNFRFITEILTELQPAEAVGSLADLKSTEE